LRRWRPLLRHRATYEKSKLSPSFAVRLKDGSTFNETVLMPWRITRDRGILAQAYSPRGSYWRLLFAQPGLLYANEGDLIFTVCAFDGTSQEGADFKSIEEILNVSEI
jgi:hypothetical protein